MYRHAVSTYFALAFGLTWLVWVPRAAALQGYLVADWAVAVGQVWTYGPALAALLAAALTGGRIAVRDLGARLVRWRVGWRWYVVVLASPAVFSLAVASVYAALGGSWLAAVPTLTGSAETWPFLILSFLILALTDGLGEETGWRGFALPRLLAVLFHAASNLWGVALLPPTGEDATPALLRTSATWLLALAVIAANRRAWTARGPDASDNL